MTNSQVFCIDCKHVKVLWVFTGSHLDTDQFVCKKSADNIPVNLVTGRRHKKFTTCSEYRDSRWSDACGPEGTFWVPRDPLHLFKFMKRVSKDNVDQ